MKYDVQLTWQDVKAGVKLHYNGRIMLRILVTLIWMFWGVCLYVELKYGIQSGDYSTFYVLLAVIVMFFGWLAWYRRRTCWQMFSQNKLYHVPRQWEFTDEVWHGTSQHSDNVYPWTSFHRWQEGEKSYLVYETDYQLHIVPKRIFGSPEESLKLRAILQKNVKGPIGSSIGFRIGRAVLWTMRVIGMLVAILLCVALAGQYSYARITPQDGSSMLELSKSIEFITVEKLRDGRGVFYMATARVPGFALPSGPPVYVFNSSGTLVEWIRDSGDVPKKAMAEWRAMSHQKITLEAAIKEIYGETQK